MKRLTDGQRSIARYLAAFYFIWLGFFGAVIMLLGGPTVAVGTEAKHLIWRIPLGAAAMLACHSRFARWTPVEQRTNFWSYKPANLTFAVIAAAILVAFATLRDA
jgi:hypothetical protein